MTETTFGMETGDRNDTMGRYRSVLRSVDRWFSGILAGQRGQMQCGKGCALCCHGLFDISLPDAFLLSEGCSSLRGMVRKQVDARARAAQDAIVDAAPELRPPYLLDGLTEEHIDGIADAAGNLPCPFLGDQNECLVYGHRPLACRLEGAPMVDVQDGLFGDWCELNFEKGVPRNAMDRLKRDYGALQDFEESCTRSLSETFLGRRRNRVTTFIPSLVVEYESFWRHLQGRIGPRP